MQEDHVRQQTQETSLEERLRDYYGPELKEQPLSQSSWQQVQFRLGPQRSAQRRFHWPIRLRRTQHVPPPYIQRAFIHVTDEARVVYQPGMLNCTLNGTISEPMMYARPWRKGGIHLLLPLLPAEPLAQAEVDILLATGLAQHMLLRRIRYWLLWSGAMLSSLCAWLVLVLTWLHRFLVIGIPIAILLCVGTYWLLTWQKRTRVLAADMLAVRWLGRSHTCQGLHALAARRQHRLHSQRRTHSTWGMPSLEERIERVCGTRINVLDDRLTLVR